MEIRRQRLVRKSIVIFLSKLRSIARNNSRRNLTRRIYCLQLSRNCQLSLSLQRSLGVGFFFFFFFFFHLYNQDPDVVELIALK